MFKIQYADIKFNAQNTPVSNQFDDIYFSTQDGLKETEYVFLQGNQLWERWLNFNQPHFIIAETGFGTGLNFFATVLLFRKFRLENSHSPLKRLFFLSFEQFPIHPKQLKIAYQYYPQFTELVEQFCNNWIDPINGCYRFHFTECYLDLWLGDIEKNLPQLGDYMYNKIDAWFLDGFAPNKNPQMWNEKLYQAMYCYTKPQGSFATFTAASTVRKGLQDAGFDVQKRKGFGLKRECLYGLKHDKSTESFRPSPQFAWYLAQSAELENNLENVDVALVGGGIASLFTALSLLERGAKVTLYCEDEEPALNASGNKQGAFYPQLSDDDNRNVRFYIHAFAYGLQRLRWAKSKFVFEHEFCGVALCGYNCRATSKLNKIAQLGLPDSLYHVLNQTELSEKVGLDLPCGGAFIEQGAWLAPREFVQTAFTFLQKYGLKIKILQKITGLEWQNNMWVLTNQHNTQIKHQIVVLANGYKITDFPQTKALPLYPVRGQVSQIATTRKLLNLKTVLCYDGYLTPVDLAKTSHCIGASHVRDNAERTFSLQEQLENQIKIQQNLSPASWINDVDTSKNQARVGVRCSVRDRIPIVGNVPNFSQQLVDYRNLFNLRRRKQAIADAAHFPNLYLVGALGSRGLTSAPLLGEYLASLIFGEPLPLSEDIIHALSPNRSWLRKLLKGTSVESI